MKIFRNQENRWREDTFLPVFTRRNTKETPNSLSNKVATKKETESVTVLAPRYSPLQETNMFVVPTFERSSSVVTDVVVKARHSVSVCGMKTAAEFN